jgi:penicillin amidase
MLWRLAKRILRLAIGLILSFALVLLVGGAWIFWRSLPPTQGTESLPGLSAEVRVWRDAYGVPHIFAANYDDAARALGYLHASERLFQMEVNRRIGQGRMAEVLGADLLKLDKFIRTLGFYHQAEASVAELSPEAQKRLQAYSDGVNAYLEAHKGALPPEFLLAGVTPEPWKPADSIVWGKVLALQLSHNREQEALRAHIAGKLGADKIPWFFPGAKPGAPITTLPALSESHASAESVDDAIGALTGLTHGASNEWVVAGSRTTTGKPILANDPHLGLTAPILWYLARIVTPDGWVKGGTFPGVPGVVLGQNQSIAWGSTTADTDVQDLFVETIDPSDPSKYLTPDGAKPFETREETIRVKGGDDVKLAVRSTRHGPVLSDVSDDLTSIAGPGKAIALAFTGLSDRDTTVEAFLRINAAKNWDDFLGALRLWQTPTQNLVYADTSGDIGFFSPGLVPLRKSGDGLAPVDGASGRYDWVGTVPFEDLPQLHNPNAGFAFNANNANVADDHQPTFGQDWEEDFRARRIQQFLDTIDKHSLETSAAMQGDRLSLAALALKPFVAKVAPSDERARQAQAMLAGWDGIMDKDRPEPLIYTAFMSALHRILMEEKTGLDMQVKGPFALTTLISLMTDHPEWCGAPNKPDPDCKATLGRAFDEGLALLVQHEGPDMTKWRWGAEHVSLLQHRVFSHVPLLDRLSDLSVPSSGGFYALDRGGGFETPKDRPFARTHGAGIRGLYDLSDPEKSRFMITTGQSGNIVSPHYGDLVQLWNNVKSFPLTGSEEELKRSGARLLTLRP